MTATLLAAVAIALYLTAALRTARWYYGKHRPSLEPVSCPFRNHRKHDWRCYDRPGAFHKRQGWAIACAWLTGLAWPLLAAAWAAWKLILAAAVLAGMAPGRVRLTLEERDHRDLRQREDAQ